MADFPTYKDLFRIARDEALVKNTVLRREVIDRAGTDANALVAAGVAIGDEIVGQLIRVQADLYLSSARGKALDRLIYDRYAELRKPAAPATVTLQFTNPSPVVVGFDIPQDTQVSTADGVVFTTIAQVTFPTGSSGPISVDAQSVLAGVGQQVRAATITSIKSFIDGAPGTLVVTNPLASFGAADEESDDDFRRRGQRFYTTSRRGTLRAIEVGALAVPGVLGATAFEIVDFSGEAGRLVQLVITDQFTRQLVDTIAIPVAYQTQSLALKVAVQQALQDVRSGGIQVFIVVGVPQIIGVTMALRYRAGADINAATAQAKAVILDYINSLQPGEPFIRNTAIDKLYAVPGLVVLGGEIISPPGDIQPQTLEVLRTDFSYIVVGSCAHD